MGSLELAQEADIILREETQVLHLVLEVGDSLDTHSERVAGIYLRIYAAGLEHIRVNHAAAENLDPACSLAECASLAAADVAADVHLGRRLREGEV